MNGLAAMQGLQNAVKEITLVGGCARNNEWTPMIASGQGCRLRRDEGGHASTALDAARLGWLADGGEEAQVCQAASAGRGLEPQSEESAAL